MTGVDSVARDLFRKLQKSSVKCCVEEHWDGELDCLCLESEPVAFFN